MPDIDVKTYLDRLRKELPYVPPIPIAKIKALHKKGDDNVAVATLAWREGAQIPRHLSTLLFSADQVSQFRPRH
jgi:hypothetical protein